MESVGEPRGRPVIRRSKFRKTWTFNSYNPTPPSICLLPNESPALISHGHGPLVTLYARKIGSGVLQQSFGSNNVDWV